MESAQTKTKLVSIILPVYNGGRFLRQSIDSCLGQTYGHLELIIVDDGSSDNTIDIVESYNDPRIKLYRHAKNHKLPAALNTGFARSSGAYITLTSHDNYYVASAIAEMVDVLERNPQADFVFADQYLVGEDGQVISIMKTGPVERLPESSCLGGCFLYTRKVYETLGDYDEKAFLAEDYDYWLRALAHFTFLHIDNPLYYYRWHSDSLSAMWGDVRSIETALAVRRRILGRRLLRNRSTLHKVHIFTASNFWNDNKRLPAFRALLWGIFFKPIALTEYTVLTLLAAICLGPRGYGLLKRAVHWTSNDR